jgi:hypothetical protein
MEKRRPIEGGVALSGNRDKTRHIVAPRVAATCRELASRVI